MGKFLKFRLPHAEDPLFGILVLLFLTVPLAFSLFTYEKFEVVKFGLWSMWVGIGIVSVSFSLWRGKSRQLFAHPAFLIFLGLFFLWAVVSTVFSPDLRNSIFGFYPRFTNGLFFFGLWSALVVLLTVDLTMDRFVFLAKVMVFDGCLVAVVGILQSLGIAYYEHVQGVQLFRGPSLLGNPNFSTMFLAGIAPLVIVFFLEARTMLARFYYGLTLLAIVLCIALLASRGALLGLAMGFVVFIILALKISKRSAIYALLSVIITAALWFSFAHLSRPQTFNIEQATEQNVQLRLFVWDIARMEILHHPWVGTGLGNFQLVFQEFRGKNLASVSGVFDDAHNLFLHLASTGGIPLVLFFSIFLAVAMWMGLKDALKGKKLVSLGSACGLLSLVVASCFTPVSTACFLLIGFLAVGCILSRLRPYSLPYNKFALGVSIFVGSILVVYAISFLIGEHILFAGYNKYYEHKYSSSSTLLKIAKRLDPINSISSLYIAADSLHLKNSDENLPKETTSFISLHSRDARSYVASANLDYAAFLQTGNIDNIRSAIDSMNVALSLDVFYAERYGYTAYYYLVAGDNKNALNYAKFAISLNPNSIPSWLLLGRIYQLQNKKPQMVYALTQAAALHPDSKILKQLLDFAKTSNNIQSLPIPVGLLPNALE